MPPEHPICGGVTRATDIYALGAVFYEMVTAHQPFTVELPLLLALKKLRHAPRLPREYANDLDSRWQNVILRCLDVKPENRFELAIDVVKALEKAPRRATRWIAGAAALACAGVIATPPIREKVAGKSASLWSAVSQYFGGARTLALLPFSPENRTRERGAFSLGLTAAVTEELGTWSDHQRGLYVVPAAEVIDTGVDTPALLQQTLGVNLIITGRIELVNDRTRITVVLNETSRDGMAVKEKRTLEIGPDDREPPESKVTAAIAQLLRASPPRAVQRRADGGPRLVEAETSCLLGRGYLLQGPGSLEAAITAFLDAIRKNERLAAAYAGASEAYLNNYAATRDVESLKNAQIKVDEAITLDPLDPRSHVIRGRVYLRTSQYGRAIFEFQRALDINPNASDAQSHLAAAYEADGAMETAEKEYRKAIALHHRY
jgi:tetratricopeptide (TPR) repeat protein